MMNIVYTDKKIKCIKGTVYVNKEYIGKKYNRWTLIDFHHMMKNPNGKLRQVWTAKCDCGTEKQVLSSSIINERSKSCGCLYKENRKAERLPDDIASNRTKMSMYKNSAKTRKLKFELTFEQFYNLTHQDCHYCKSKPSVRKFKRKTSEYTYLMNGIDRLDSNIGYLIDNCVPCCDTCNRAKLDHSLEFFKDWIKKVAANI